MRAVVITGVGGPEVLAVREVPDPVPGPEEVLVRVRATALNRADLLQRRGRYPAPPGAPADVPGLEFAGQVLCAGERVRELRPGARVMGILGGGGYAERVAVHEGLCLRVPEDLDWQQAAAIPEAFLTAFDALHERARLGADAWLLVHAAASGVGLAALGIAAALEARTIALSRSPDKRARLAALGVTVLDPGSQDLARAIREAAGGEGVDVVLELVGAPTWPLDLEVLRPGGRLVLLGLLGGARAETDLAAVLAKRLTIVGSTLRGRALHEKIALTRAFDARMGPLVADGRLRATVDRVLPLERAAEAHALLERNASFGKVVLTVGGA